MSAQVREVGTFSVDGLLEGPVWGDESFRDRLVEWTTLARSGGYGFSIELDGGNFSLLGDNRPAHAQHPDVSVPLRDLLQQLVDMAPAEQRASLFSTIRTTQWDKGTETQTLYVISGGHVEARQRTVDANTRAASKPLSRAQLLKTAALAFLVLCGAFLVSSIFVDYKELFAKVWNKVGPVNVKSVQLDPGPFASYLKVEGVESASGGRQLQLTMNRLPGYPASQADVESLASSENTGLALRRVLESLAAGYARVEQYDDQGKWITSHVVRIGAPEDPGEIKVLVPFSREKPPSRISLMWE